MDLEENARKFKEAPAVQWEGKRSDRDWTPRLIALIVTVGFLYLHYHLMTHVIDSSMREMVTHSLATLDTIIVFVISYYFGSSLSSSKKTQVLEDLKKKE